MLRTAIKAEVSTTTVSLLARQPVFVIADDLIGGSLVFHG